MVHPKSPSLGIPSPSFAKHEINAAYIVSDAMAFKLMP